MIEKILGLIGIYYYLQNNSPALLRHLFDWHAFLDLDIVKVQNLINLLYLYLLISLHNVLIQPYRQQFIVPVIVLTIMACFFSSINSYSLGKKTNTSHLLSSFYSKIVIVICFILAIAIKDLVLRQKNKKLVTKKSVIWFESTSLKKATSIQVLAILFHF